MTANYVYVIRYAPKLHKIGISTAPNRRLLQLECDAWPSLEVVKTWRRPNGDAAKVERTAHEILRGYRSDCLGTRERFSVGPKAACAAVDLAVLLLGEQLEAEELLPDPSDIALHQLAEMPTFLNRCGYIRLNGREKPDGALIALRKLGVARDMMFVDTVRTKGRELVVMLKQLRAGDFLYLPRQGDLGLDARERAIAKGATIAGLSA